MSKRNRIFAGVLLIFIVGIVFLIYRIASGLDIRYRESTEQIMVDTANILAAWLETEISNNQLATANIKQAFAKVNQRRFDAHIYSITKQQVDLRVYVIDSNGIVVFDSLSQALGEDFRSWHDINLALDGRYGARTTRDNPNDPATTVMYVAVPIYQGSKIFGAVSVSKAVASHRELLLSAQQQLIYLGLITLAGVLVLLTVLSVWLTNPSRLTHDLTQVFKQEKLSQPRRWLNRLRTVLNSAFLDMRDAMAGRNYSENYIQSLTHELKSPLTAIRGAAELLNEPMTDAQRERFIDNITTQAQRLQDLAERLLELTSLEQRRSLENPQSIEISQLLEDVLTGLETCANLKAIRFLLTVEKPVYVNGDSFLLQRALTNLIENALDFSPIGSAIKITITRNRRLCEITIRDHGSGIPDYALDRIFEKFYSLRRPDTGQKSTGLGLPFVREITQLHGGKVSMMNHAEGGALSQMVLPLSK